VKERAVGVRAALPVVLATEVVAIGAFIGLTPARFGWWPAAAITAAAFVLMVVTVYRRNLPGWIAALMRWRSRRRGREHAAAAVDVMQGNLVCGVRVDAYEAITMVQTLTDWLKQSRLIVVAVEMDKGRVRVKGDGEVCSDLSCGEQTLVVSDEDPTGSLESLNPGDIVKVERATGKPDRIVVVRRVWEELTSPEF